MTKNLKEKEIAEVLLEEYNKMHIGDAPRIAKRILNLFRLPNCSYCGGKGIKTFTQELNNTGATKLITGDICSHCNGIGKVLPVMKQINDRGKVFIPCETACGLQMPDFNSEVCLDCIASKFCDAQLSTDKEVLSVHDTYFLNALTKKDEEITNLRASLGDTQDKLKIALDELAKRDAEIKLLKTRIATFLGMRS